MRRDLRSAGALLGSALVLHLSLLAGDLACAGHDAHGGSAAASAPPPDPAQAADPHAHHGMAAAPAPDDGSASDEPCRTPVQSECCSALASCALAVAFAEASVRVPDQGASARPARLESVPLSRLGSPEPPPPKA